MKKILSILGIVNLVINGSGNLIACDNNNFFKNKLSPEEIKKRKKEKKL